MNFDPDTIWLFTTGDVPRESLDRFSDTTQGQAVTVHIVRTKPAEQDDWLRDWTRPPPRHANHRRPETSCRRSRWAKSNS